MLSVGEVGVNLKVRWNTAPKKVRALYGDSVCLRKSAHQRVGLFGSIALSAR